MKEQTTETGRSTDAAKFTKGPFTWEHKDTVGTFVYPDLDLNGGDSICECFGPEQQANAKLIAASPRMFAALEKLAAWDTERNFLGAPHVAIVEEARRAIQLATE